MRFVSLIAALIVHNTAAFAQTPNVQSFNPTGSVKSAQQVTVRFSTDMVPMGDPKFKLTPFAMECKGPAPKSTTRWADSRNWVVDFDKTVPAGVSCEFKATANLKDLKGQAVAAGVYNFSTSGPAIKAFYPRYGEIEPTQYFVIQMDGEIDPASLAKGAYFEIDGTANRVPVKLITGKDRDIVLQAAIENEWEWNAFERLIKATKKPLASIPELKSFLVIGSQRKFPDGGKVALHWTKGIRSRSGLAVQEEQTHRFEVIDSFKATFSCERTEPSRPCNPILNMSVDLSRSLPIDQLKAIKLVASGGRTWTPEEFNKSRERRDTRYITFKGPFPEKTKFQVFLPRNLKDDLGRPLTNQNKFPLDVATDEYSPLIKFAAPFGILEMKADPILPVSVRNVEKNLSASQTFTDGRSLNLTKATEIIEWYNRVQTKSGEDDKRGVSIFEGKKGQAFQLPKPLGEREFELIGIPLKKPGLHVVELRSPKLGAALLGKAGDMYVASAALVTDMGVHFKKGRESSVIWVTQLSDGRPVAGAKVSIITTAGKTLAHGTTNASGLFSVSDVKYPCEFGGEDMDYRKCPVYAFAQKGDDLSFASSRWTEGIESYRFNVSTEYLRENWGPMRLHTLLDRMVAQPGDKVNMKHILREYRMNGFAMMTNSRLPKRVLVVHQGSNTVYTLPFEFNASTGAAVNSFTLPKQAQLGTYAIYLSNRDKMPQREEGDESDPFDYSAEQTGSFVVSKYRLPLMKATASIQGTPLITPPSVKVDLSAAYLSGGPASDLKVKVRASMQSGYFEPDVPGGTDYSFFSPPVKPGLQSEDRGSNEQEAFLKTLDVTLDKNGGRLATLDKLPAVQKVQLLSVEMEFMDPNGETKTVATSAPIFPSEFVIGLRSDSWYAEAGKANVAGVVTTNLGKPQAGRAYTVEAFTHTSYTHRKRLVGGFYSFDSKNEIKSLGQVCEGKTDAHGRFTCQPQSLPAGSVILQAKTQDEKGRVTYARVNMHVRAAGEDTWYTPSDSDRIDLLPEQNAYEPGEKARLVVRTPFASATALVTVEREGVLDAFVTEVKRDDPAIEVPLKGHYAPNVYVSVLLVRGRVADPKPTALLDLARPALKMGLVKLKVGWKDHRLDVAVKTDKKRYRVREKVQVSIEVKAANGQKLPAGSEVALIAVDEALLRLKPNTSWKFLENMMGERGLAVDTSSGQNQVIGRRHFGAKARPAGGGGGTAADPRELFDPMLHWAASVKLDRDGRAQATIPLNDSLTSFRIVALATGGSNLFGDGAATVESTKDLIIYSGFAPLVREGDDIGNVFTVRNTTAKAMKVDVKVSAPELGALPALAPVELKPSEAKTVNLPLKVPVNLTAINFRIEARDAASGAEDVMIAKVKVSPAVPVRVQQATLFQLEKSHTIPVRQPADNLANKGGLSVSARSTLVTGLAGVKAYMQDYPYTCLEQQASKAVALEDRADIDRIVGMLPAYQDAHGLLKFFPTSLCGSEALTRHVINIFLANGVKFPEESLDKMTEGLKMAVQGQYSCRSWWDGLVADSYRNEQRVLSIDTLSRAGKFSKDMMSTVEITPNLWQTETLAAWDRLLGREAGIANRDDLKKKSSTLLRARMNFQGSLMNLQGQLPWEAAWRLFTTDDQQALSVFGAALADPSWNEDIGRMARGVTARLKRGTWDTTLANAWGVTYLREFSAKFESVKPAGETLIAAGDVKASVDWKKNPAGEKQLLAWPKESLQKEVAAKFEHQGEGKPWIHFEILAARPLKAPLELGYSVTRKVTWFRKRKRATGASATSPISSSSSRPAPTRPGRDSRRDSRRRFAFGHRP
ncbi:MAG: hypothetical protein KF767_00885 [Bdellovibrionaceae bacterium]|nr:hypothetical protein [Pseudobdellovibrionaceae bacterium]